MTYDIILGREEAERAKFGTRGTLFLGKHYVKMAQITALAQQIHLDLNKAHVVFVCGKRGSGKCLTGDTLITLDDGRQIPIRDLSEEEGKILALDNNLKINPNNKTGFYARTVEEVLKIRLRSGKSITLTPEHPLLSVRGWQEARYFTAGSRLATPRIIRAFGSQSMKECEIKILAYMIAEGHAKQPLFFTNSDQMIVDDFKNAVKEFQPELFVQNLNSKYGYKINAKFETRNTIKSKFERNQKGQFMPGGEAITQKRKIREFLEEHNVYGKLSGEKMVPESILSAPKHQVALFLNRLFSCDGSIYFQNGWEISYASKSEKLIRQVQHILLRFEILSKLRDKYNELNGRIFHNYELVINSSNVDKFNQEIGFFGVKEERQKISLEENKKIRQNPNVDTIPKELWDVYRPKSWVNAGKELGYTSPKAARSSINYAPSRQKLLTIAKSDENEAMIKLAQSDIFWDEVVSVESIKGEIPVYDITVPEYHNFVANDIIVHNSYCEGVIAEGIATLDEAIRQKLSVIILDTMGIYWTMKYPNHKDEKLLKEWGLEGKEIENLKIYTPQGFFKEYKEKGIPTDAPFSIDPSELGPEDWWTSFELNPNEPIGVLIERVILELKKQGKYSIKDIISSIEAQKEDEHVKEAAKNRFKTADSWGLFSSKATPVKELAAAGQVTILDLSAYAVMPNGWKIKSLALGLVSKRMFMERMTARKEEEYKNIHKAVHYILEEEHSEEKEEMPIVWLLIDEAHEFIPYTGKTAASDALITLLREGRQPGVAMVMATQQPGKIHTDAMTQSDIILAHRLTSKIDIDSLGNLLQTYMRGAIDRELANLPKIPGTCIAVDDVNERIYPMKIRPRFSWHGGGAPSIIEEEKNAFEFNDNF